MTHSEIWEEKFLLLVIANRKAGMPMSEAKSSAFADIIVQMTLARLERLLSPVSVTATVIPNDGEWHDFPTTLPPDRSAHDIQTKYMNQWIEALEVHKQEILRDGPEKFNQDTDKRMNEYLKSLGIAVD